MSFPQNTGPMRLAHAWRCIQSGYEWIPPEMAAFKESLDRMPPQVDRKQATKNALLLGYGEQLLRDAMPEPEPFR